MSNPFTSLITPEFKNLHRQMIEALLECESCSVDCTVTLEGTKFTDCPNCEYSVTSGKSANIYRSGGPIPFNHGICPYCNGNGKTTLAATETVCLIPIWNSKGWIGNIPHIQSANVVLQSISKIDTLSILKRASKINVDNDLAPYGFTDLVREGDPQPMGFGGSYFIVCNWKKA